MPEAILLTCKTCGRDFMLPEGMLLSACPACGTHHSRPRAAQSALADLRRAHQQRCSCDFINAEANYQRVLNAHPDEAEALWGLALCKYGVEYVQDDKTSRYLPTIHFLNRKPFTEDPDCRLAIARADEDIRPRYQQDAEYITRIQQEVLAAEVRGTDCDVFLCYKQSVPGSADPDARSHEFFHAQELYVALRDAGFRVFFAHTTLRRAAGANYEAQIFHALQSARVMLVITSTPAHLMTPWVHSEWQRYLERIDAGDGCRLIPLLYDGCDPYALPDAFLRRSIQGLRMDSLTALDDLRQVLDTCIPRKEEPAQVVTAHQTTPATDPLLRRAFLFLEDSDWKSADEYCERVLDADPECALAYVGKLMAALQVRKQEKLRDQAQPFDSEPDYRKALRFADATLAKELQGMVAHINERNENAMKEEAYQKAEQALATAKIEQDFSTVKKLFETISGWKDADQQIEQCQQKIEEIKARKAVELKERRQKEETAREAKKKATQRRKRIIGIAIAVIALIAALVLLVINVIIPIQKYDEGTKLLAAGDTAGAAIAFRRAGWYRDGIERSMTLWDDIAVRDVIAAGDYHTVGLRADGSVVAVGVNSDGQLNTSRWKDIVAIAAGNNHTVGLRADGSVVTVGYSSYDQLDTADWSDIVAISAGDYHTVGLRADGSVVAVGNNSCDQLDTADWSDIVAISAGGYLTVGLRADGSVVAVGDNSYDQLDTTDWSDIVAIAAGVFHTVGLRADGSVVAVGWNTDGQCDVSDWSDIVAIAVGDSHTVGLRADGSVVAVGGNSKGQLNTSRWKDIVAIAAGDNHTVGLRADGTVTATEWNPYGQCDVSDYQLKRVPRPTLTK